MLCGCVRAMTTATTSQAPTWGQRAFNIHSSNSGCSGTHRTSWVGWALNEGMGWDGGQGIEFMRALRCDPKTAALPMPQLQALSEATLSTKNERSSFAQI